MAKVKRPYKGEGNPRAKLTWEKVRDIRRLYKTGEFSVRNLAYLYDVTHTSIQNIVTNKTWEEETNV